jgi:serine phosphatase RsbU (regulator of sigma subunit)
MEPPCDLELQVAVAKVSKYAVSESGDTVETIERPHGGLSIVVVDGQRSGSSAKAISNIVARKAVSLLADGVRDGAAARAAHDYLRTQRGGQVSATLDIVSVDLATRTIVISRNSHCPVIVVTGPPRPLRSGECRDAELRLLDEPSEAIGIHARTRPVIAELPIALDTHLVVFTDGLLTAGERYGQPLDVPTFVRDQLQAHQPPTSAQTLPAFQAGTLADALLARAIELEQGRPGDDVSVVVLSVVTREAPDAVRRLTVRFPIPAWLAGIF